MSVIMIGDETQGIAGAGADAIRAAMEAQSRPQTGGVKSRKVLKASAATVDDLISSMMGVKVEEPKKRERRQTKFFASEAEPKAKASTAAAPSAMGRMYKSIHGKNPVEFENAAGELVSEQNKKIKLAQDKLQAELEKLEALNRQIRDARARLAAQSEVMDVSGGAAAKAKRPRRSRRAVQ